MNKGLVLSAAGSLPHKSFPNLFRGKFLLKVYWLQVGVLTMNFHCSLRIFLFVLSSRGPLV